MDWVVGIIVGCIAIIYSLLRFWKWWRPLRVSAGYTRSFVERREQINATITNLTDKDQVLITCAARPMRPFRYALFRHLQRPIASWRFRQNIWFAGQRFSFLANDEPLRLSPGEQKTLTFRLNLESPLHQFMAREFIIEVQLSNRRTFRSKRLIAPDNWLFRPKMVKSHTETIPGRATVRAPPALRQPAGGALARLGRRAGAAAAERRAIHARKAHSVQEQLGWDEGDACGCPTRTPWQQSRDSMKFGLASRPSAQSRAAPVRTAIRILQQGRRHARAVAPCIGLRRQYGSCFLHGTG